MKKIKKFENKNLNLEKIKGGDYTGGTVASDGSFTDERTVTSANTSRPPRGSVGHEEVDEFHYTS
jgi:hypothetical protein